MSDNLGFDANNLCIAEDAFEQFQAVAMYQEPPHVTLATADPSKELASAPNEFCDLGFDNEVIVGTEVEINTILSEPCVLEDQRLTNSSVADDNCEQDNISPRKNKKKSRKLNVSNDDSPLNSINCAIIGSKPSQDSEEKALIKQRSKASSKRPKKTKSKSTHETPPEVSNTPLKALNTDPETNDNKRMRTRPKRLSSSNIQLYSMSYTSDSDHSDSYGAHRLTKSVKSMKTTKKSRSSRKKSLATNIETEVEQEDNPEKLTELCKTLELNPVKSKTDKKGKTNKINIISDIKLTDNEDLDNMSLSQIKGLPRPSNTDENNISESNKTHNTTNGDKHAEVESQLQPYNKSTEKNKSRKRGRPKKDSVISPEKPSSDEKSSSDTAQMTNENNKNTHTLNDVSETVHSTTACDTVTEANTTLENNISEGCNASIDVIGASSKRNTKMPIMSDFEYNIDKVIDKESTENQNIANNNDNSLLVEDTSKRRARKNVPLLRYEEESDEDPFANIELSDDDEPRIRKGKRYYSDDEYVPGKREYKDINSTDSEAPELIDEAKAQRKKRIRSKKSDSQSPRKKINNDKQDTTQDDDVEDVEMVLQGSVVKESENLQPSKIWGSSNEFENFLAKKIQGTNLKITKVSSTEPTETRTLEIPMIDQEARKTIEMCTQTNILKMVSTGMQTTPPHDVPMKENVTLTAEQSEKACDFLSGIVKTTAELGTLMTQKSEDFIAKKINTANVNDTMKVDYCVKKSFLLFKLAKHNLMQMEEDLAKQYEEFLMSNNLTACREQQKEVIPKPNEISSDSDCEIVETPVQASVGKREDKLKFNPKTVFLNKELSIKITKKPTENKTLNIKGHHAIWISDTVMVKKVPPTQSFLAQDSRNKKPPDNKITTKMVSDFFKSYNRERVLSTCAPFVTTDWLNVNKECVCNYFVVKPHPFNNNVNYPENGGIGMNSSASNTRASARNNNFSNVKNTAKSNIVTSPETLFKMCYRKVRNQLHDQSHVQEVCQQMQNELTDGKKEPVTLLQLSLRALAEQGADITGSSPPPSQTIPSDETSQSSALPLKTLCYHKVVDLLHDTSQNDSRGAHQSGETMLTTVALNGLLPTSSANYVSQENSFKNEIKTLLSLCVELIQKNQVHDTNIISIFVPKTLKSLTFKCVERLLYANFKQNLILSSQLSSSNCHNDDDITTPGLTINSVNTLSEEAFLNLEQSLVDAPDSSEYFDDFDHDDHYESEFIETEDNNQEEPNWVSQVQLKELRSCVNTNIPDVIEEENVLLQTQIKLEPIDDTLENVDGMACVKIEPTSGLDEMTMLPDIKPDFDEPARQNSSSYNIDEFEDFVTSNKLMSGLHGDDIFSQSASRVRRQHEPDYYEEVDTSMSLLIPQAYEPLSVDNAKGSLMESSSDEDNSKNKKVAGKKKVDKRSKGKNKKLEQKPTSKEIPAQTKEKPSNIEVANLTKKMRDKINQEEKCDDSTDSENDDLPRRLRKKKEDSQAHTSTTKDSDIQCNNVDSTDKVEDDVGTFTGFTAIDQNEISTYQKYMKYVYDKIIPNDEPKPDLKENTAAIGTQDSNVGDIINPNEPVELLECEPTMPFFDDVVEQKRNEVKSKKMADRPLITKSPASFVDRHGWHCYPVNPEDTKIYLNNYVVLEKLPESFVQTYFKYQGISLNKNDAEINRLTNLNSLSRKVKESKSKKSKKDGTGAIKSEPGSRSNSPSHSDHYDELEPSDDEGTRVEDEVAPPVAQRQTENALAKNLLMDDNNSDGDEPLIKKEPLDDDAKRPKRNSNSKKTVAELDGEDLMLTADKMMNKELNLLHAPVLPEELKENTSKGPITRNKQKSATKNQPSGSKVKGEEDSSSEEEKQWVTTKEKLLKRLCKKDDQGLDDAKRAKLVNEFIERRADFPDSHQRSRHKSKRTSKKYLERQKQLRVLSRELFGEPDPSTSKRSQKAQASLLYKGRRNIRKVIDKKSLARSTVMANMEEFERKRRLNARQAALRERLGCEEGVNVLVINDEVCLEYDFEANRPIVTVHSFFTKVMKAHQYEGVKFMWDACFESLSELEAGRGGGGCILAHCMGLGKTLQVLALLHTVLTHPRVGIKRVLVVCPLSTVLNWVDEIHKWIGPVTNKIKVFELSKLKKTYERAYQLEDWYNGGGIFIIGYELFRSLSTLDPFLDDIRPTIINKIRTALLDPGPDIIVCDEGHLLKNDCSVLSVAMSRVVTKRRIILTGTPMQNNLREYYCMVNFVKPNLLGTYAEYSNRFENPIMNGQHRDSREEDIKLMKARTHILHKVLEGCLQRQEASVLYPYLPKKHEYTLFITQTKCQWELYKHYLTHYGNQTKQSILKDFHILQKIWSHPQVLHNFQTKAQDRRNKIKAEKLEDDLATEDLEEIKPNPTDLWWLEYLDGGNMLETLDSSNKFVVVFRILNECTALGDKVLIFSTSLFCLDAVEYFLKKINKWSLGQEYYRLDGSVPAEVRQKWCREFNADNNYKTKLFLVSTRAGCLGLNMTAANRVIIMDTSWNPAHDIQSIFRVYRFGQKKDCFIYRLVAMGTMEQKIYERSVTKQAVACRVVDEQQIDRHYNMADLTELYKFDELGSSVAGGVAVGVADVALLRVARLPALHAVHEHDSLLRDSSEQGLPEHERNAAWMQFQQEQTHKQIENKLVQEVPNTSMKRLHGHDYALSPIPPEIKTEDKSEDFKPSEPKQKKGKKIIKCCIPIQDNKNKKNVPDIKVEEPMPTTSRANKRHASPEPGTSKQDDKLEPEEVMVERITDILLKHNFQHKKGNSDIAKLVTKVRNLVSKGFIDKEDTTDELTASIANILIPRRVSVPAATDIICESINNSAAPCFNTDNQVADPPVKPGPASRKNKKVNTQPVMTTIKTETGIRTKRRAALQAEKHIDSLVQDVVIDLDDEDTDSADVDFVPDVVEKPQNINKSQKKTSKNGAFLEDGDSDASGTLTASSLSPSKFDDSVPSYANSNKANSNTNNNKPSVATIKFIKTKNESPKPVANKDTPNQTKQKANEKRNPPAVEAADCSIILSDDEEPEPQSKTQKKIEKKDELKTLSKPKKDVEPKKVVETKKVIEKPVESDEIVPLPISMLKNQNFINIVAHTYLAGNPMLDEDAANLAAQYSTLKAFNEAQRTGKDVCSGPIYDIAVKVIGKDVLKKMRTLNDKADSATAEAVSANTEMNKRLMASQEPEKPGKSSQNETSYARALRDDLINGKLGTNVEIKEKEQPVDVPPTPIAGSMVSVGLIQSRAELNNSNSFDPHGGECILPDSQNTITNDISASVTATVQTLTAQKRLSYVETKKPLILRQVLLSKQQNEESKVPNTPISVRRVMPNVTLSTNAKLAFNKPNVPTSTPTKPAVAAVTNTTSDNTICLDSDEEDAVPPTPRPATITQVTSNTSTITPAQHKSTPNMQAQAMPVPVSLTMANAPGVTLPLATLQNLAPPVATSQPLILKQVTGGNGLQSNFVLVPSDQLPLPLKPTTSTPVQATQPQPINSVLIPQSNFKTVKIDPSKLKPSPCKPGDILKITKLGSPVVQKQKDKNIKAQNNKVQDKKVAAAKLLNSIDLTDKPAPTSSKPQKPSSTVTINLTDEVCTTPPKASIGKEKKPKKPAHTSYDESNSSDASLSIFKDVIQIQASDYSEPSAEAESSKKSNIVQSVKTYNSPMLVQHVVSTDKYSTTIKLADGKKLTQVPNNKVPKHIDAAVKIKIEGSKKKQTLFKSKDDDPKGMSSNKKASFKTINVGNTPEKKGSSSKQTSTSVATATVDLTNVPVPYFSAVTMANTKRQSSTIDKTTVKRKKSELMTLKDFDLDDIDDIIELE